MQFIIVSREFAGLGFATRLQDEGHEVILATKPSASDEAHPDRMRAFDLVGRDLVRREPLDALFNRPRG